MKLKLVFLSAIFVALIFGGVETNAKASTKKESTKLNVREPIDILKSSYENMKGSLDIVKTLIFLVDVVYCLMPGLFTSRKALAMDNYATSLNAHFNDSRLHFTTEQLFKELPDVTNIVLSQDPPGDFCNSLAFGSIHRFVWNDDDQLEDLVHFLGKFGYPEIYDTIKGLYLLSGCSEELIKDLPEKPDGNVLRKRVTRNIKLSASNVREALLQSRKAIRPRQEDPKCNIQELIGKLPETGLIQLLQFIETLMYQFSTNHNLHFLVGKLQEPIKGRSVREFRNLDAVKGILTYAHQELIKKPIWRIIFEVIRDITGVDYFVLNPLNFVFSLFEFIVWGTPFPPEHI